MSWSRARKSPATVTAVCALGIVAIITSIVLISIGLVKSRNDPPPSTNFTDADAPSAPPSIRSPGTSTFPTHSPFTRPPVAQPTTATPTASPSDGPTVPPGAPSRSPITAPPSMRPTLAPSTGYPTRLPSSKLITPPPTVTPGSPTSAPATKRPTTAASPTKAPTRIVVPTPTATAPEPASTPTSIVVPVDVPLRPGRGETIRLINENSATLESSYDGEILLLEMVLSRNDVVNGVPISPRSSDHGNGDDMSTLIPAGRSYDGRIWEAVPPLYLNFDCSAVSVLIDGSRSHCAVSLPSAYDGAQVSHYKVKSVVVEQPTAEEDAAKFLIQTTFGPRQQDIDEIVESMMSPEQWIKKQMNEELTPATLHRAHYRRHANQRLRPGAGQDTTGTFGIRNPCDVGSRWNRFAFTELDIGKELVAVTLSSGNVLLKIDGRARTEVPSHSMPRNVVICSVEEYVGGKILVGSKNAEKLCRGSASTATIRNRAITFTNEDVAPYTIPDAYLVDMAPKVVDSMLLRTLKFDDNEDNNGAFCPFSGPAPKFLRAWDNENYTGSYSYYVHDPRAQLIDATPGSTDSYPRNALASSVATCPRIPKTFLNQDTCQPMRGDCASIAYGTGKRITLDYETMRRFYELDGRYVYVVKGLPVEGTPSPCARAKGKQRWVRYNADNDAQGCPGGDTDLPPEVSAILKAHVSAELGKRDMTTKESVRAIDVAHRERCNDDGAAVGASITVGNLGCWTHSRPGEWGVFDASWWVFSHPGNSPRHRKFLSNPIAEVAEIDKEDVEKSVTLTFPAWHPSDRWKFWLWTSKSLGGYGDTVDFSRLPRGTQGPGMAEYVGAVSAGDSDDAFEFCGSPGEAANDPTRGSQYGLYDEADQAKVTPTSLDQDHEPEHSKAMVWTSVVLNAPDQLRQRMAFALSQIFVVSSSGLEMRKQTEPFMSYYDIFIRNAFGRFGDILKEVSFSPMMGRYLTYLGSKSFSHSYEDLGEQFYPDENMARGKLQVISIYYLFNCSSSYFSHFFFLEFSFFFLQKSCNYLLSDCSDYTRMAHRY